MVRSHGFDGLFGAFDVACFAFHTKQNTHTHKCDPKSHNEIFEFSEAEAGKNFVNLNPLCGL